MWKHGTKKLIVTPALHTKPYFTNRGKYQPLKKLQKKTLCGANDWDAKKCCKTYINEVPNRKMNKVIYGHFKIFCDGVFSFKAKYKSEKGRIIVNTRGAYRTAATSKMEYFVIIVDGWKPLTFITKSSILDVATVPDLSLNTMLTVSFQQVPRNVVKSLVRSLRWKRSKCCFHINQAVNWSMTYAEEKMLKWHFHVTVSHSVLFLCFIYISELIIALVSWRQY